jgi:expansin (peptidoglycan-binding protein)
MVRRRVLLSLIPFLAACGSAAGGSTTGDGGQAAGSGGGPATGSTGNGGEPTTSGTGTASTTNGSTTSASTTSGTSSTTSGGGNACSTGLPEYTAGNGSVTFYTLGSLTAAVNCGFGVTGAAPDVVSHVATGNGLYFGAMNTADYDDAAACGACVELTRDGTKKVVVTIVDQCPSASNTPCKPGHIDLSAEAFLQLGAATEGYLGTGNGGAVGVISWRYVACPVTGDVSFQLKDPSNMYWNQILVEGHRYPVTKVEVKVNGQWAPAVRQSYNYWQAGDGNMGAPPYQVRVTDTNGDTVEGSLDLTGAEQPSSAQFPLCQ